MAFKDGVRSRNTNWAKTSTPGNVMPNLSPLKGGLIPWTKGRPLGRQEVQPKAGPKAPLFISLQNLPIDRNLSFYWVNSGNYVLLCGLCFRLERQCGEGCSTVNREMSQPSDSSKGPVNQTLGRKPGAGTQA